MSGGLISKSWILLGVVTIVLVSCLPPLASGDNNTTVESNTTLAPGNRTAGLIATTPTKPPPAGIEADSLQKEIANAILVKNCTVELANCTTDNKVDPGSNDVNGVCKTMQGYIECVERNCDYITDNNRPDALQKAKDKYKRCSGCALQMSAIIMLMALIVSRLF